MQIRKFNEKARMQIVHPSLRSCHFRFAPTHFNLDDELSRNYGDEPLAERERGRRLMAFYDAR